MDNTTIVDEIKSYSDKLGAVLKNLSTQGDVKTNHTPREKILEDNKLTLYHYPSENTSKKTPLLIVYALVNRPTILDLQKDHSVIAELISNGEDVYLVDWGYPDKTDSKTTFDDYVNHQLASCVNKVCALNKVGKINIMGICQGGVISLCYSSFHPKKVKNLSLLVTPIDFHTKDDCLSSWVKHIDIDLMVDTLGNISGNMLSNSFLALKPYQLQLKKYLDLVNSFNKYEDDHKRIRNFISMEQWIIDSPDQAGEAFRYFIKSCYQQNRLKEGTLELNGKCVDYSKLTMPILNIYAEQDHIVPPASSKALRSLVNHEKYQEMPVSGGHVGIFASKKSIKKIFPAISQWLD